VFPFDFKGKTFGIVVETERLTSLCESTEESHEILRRLAGDIYLWANAQWADDATESGLIEAGKMSCFRVVALSST
jgi:hypothetical protein